jgi:outer membrane receptor protein involved in Fe transport
VKQVSLSFFACLLLVFGFSTITADALVLYGSMVGTVTDQSDAAVPKAEVTATNGATNQTYRDVTDDQGRYSISDVAPGKYTVKVSAPGFRTLVQNELTVAANNVSRSDLKLAVGQVSEQVTVEGQAVLLQTDKSDVHSEITSVAIENLPLTRFRNYQQLINLVPGATPASFQNSITDTPGRALQTHVNGANAQSNNTRLDGAQNINVWLPHHVAYVAPSDTIETVNVATDAFDAEQGMAGGAAVTVITKSGTNDIHGSAFTFYDNQHLKTRNFFQAPGTQKPFGTTLISGGTVGGAIIKNKLFYFGGWERTGDRNGAVVTATLPTADQRLGDFSAYKTAAFKNTVIYDPNTGNPDGSGRTAFTNNIIPTSRLSPQALAAQSLLPAPNLGGTTANYFVSGTPNVTRNQYDLKINYQATSRNMIWGKYSVMDANVLAPPSLGAAEGAGIGGDAGTGHTFQQLGTIGHTWVISPNMVLDGTLGYTRLSQYVLGTDYGTNFGSDTFKIPGTNGADPRQSGIPSFIFNTYATIGNVNTWMPLFRTDETYTNSDNLTWTHGAHEFRFGFDMIRYHLNHFQPELGGGPRGQFTFNGGTTGTTGYSNTQFNSYAAFLLGQPDDVEKSYQNILMTGREWQFGWYARDRWQVTRKLTLNIGLRYEYYPLMTRCCGKGLERYDPSTNLLYLGGRGNVPVDAGYSVSGKLFAPRFGFAYRMGENTVIRAGYGISYDPIPYSRPLRGFYPLTINYVYTGNTGLLPGSTLAAGIPAPNFPDLSTGIISLPGNVTERSPTAGEIKRGYIQSWNFTIERKLPLNMIGSVAYVGTQTTHQLADFDINSGVPGSTNANLPLAKFGRTAALDEWGGYLSSHYHSLQTSVNKQLSAGLFVKAAYTWSKAIDYTDDDGWATPARMYGFQWNRAVAGYDRTHVFQAGWVYQLPFGKGQKYVNNGPTGYILGNWKLNGTLSAFTGVPITVTADGTSVAAGPDNQQTADQVKANVQYLGGIGAGHPYYDPTAFAAVTGVRFGNTGRNILRGPGVFNTDLSLFRDFPIKERLHLEFRTDCFNITNTPKFPNPQNATNTSVSSGSFMQITQTLSNGTALNTERQFRFGLRMVF